MTVRLQVLNYWRIFMKLVQSIVVAALLAVPALSFAQSNQPLTRAQVRAELVQLQQAGYNPASDNTQYPVNIEAALSHRGEGCQLWRRRSGSRRFGLAS